ncbi:MAG: YihY family inner membrane protein [Rhodospirillales bacterium]
MAEQSLEREKTPESTVSTWAGRLDLSRRFAAFLWNRFVENDCLQLAASLSYTSLLAIVPLTAIAFAMLAAFPVFEGMREHFQSIVFSNLLPQSAEAMREYFDQFVRNTAKLTAVGIVGLAVIAVLLLGTIESALNSIFRVIRPRAVLPRLLVFWALLTLGPLMLGASFSLSTYFFALTKSIGVDAFAGEIGWLTKLAPTAIMIVVFSLFYLIIPNRPVRFSNALIGGAVAGVLFGILREVFALYVSNLSVYQTIYGAASIVPIFLIWTYLSWNAVLMGAILTASLEEWRSTHGMHASIARLRDGQRLVLAVSLLQVLFEAGRLGRGVSTRTFANRLNFGTEAIERILFELHKKRYLENTSAHTWVLARRLDDITLYDLMRSLEIGFRPEDFSFEADGWRRRLAEPLQDMVRGEKTAGDVALQDIFADSEKPDEEHGEDYGGQRGGGSGKPPHLKPVF